MSSSDRDGARPRRAPTRITSLTNERVKLVRSLEMRKVRRETGLFVAEGASVLETARIAGWVPEMLIHQTGAAQTPVSRGLADWALEIGCEVLEVSGPVLEKLAAKDNPQSLMAVFRQRWAPPPDPGHLSQCSVVVALEEIRDPGNLGTIVRTADAVGAAGVVLVGTTTDPFSRDCVRATMGSIFEMGLTRLDVDAFCAYAAAWPAEGGVVGTHLEAKDDFRTMSYSGPTLLVMGGEGPGLSPKLTAACRRLVKIPMAGKLDSLNLAVATALALYQIRGPALRL